MSFHPQQTLSIQLNDFATFENFIPGQNTEVFAQLSAMLAGRGERFFYLFGQLGSGRSHLLQACCHHAKDAGKTSFYLDLNEAKNYGPAICEGLEHVQVICIDDIDVIAKDPIWEEALFHLYNRVRSLDGSLIVAATVAPRFLSLNLPDLISRLAWGLVYPVLELEDTEKISALQLRAASRGFFLSEPVGAFLVKRCARNMRDLYDILAKLDSASLSAGRKLTIPFVKSVLAL